MDRIAYWQIKIRENKAFPKITRAAESDQPNTEFTSGSYHEILEHLCSSLCFDSLSRIPTGSAVTMQVEEEITNPEPVEIPCTVYPKPDLPIFQRQGVLSLDLPKIIKFCCSKVRRFILEEERTSKFLWKRKESPRESTGTYKPQLRTRNKTTQWKKHIKVSD